MTQNFVLSGKSCNTIEFALLCKEVLKKIRKFYLYIFLLGQLEDSLLLLSLSLLLLLLLLLLSLLSLLLLLLLFNCKQEPNLVLLLTLFNFFLVII